MSRPLSCALSCAAVLSAALGATPSFAALVLNTGGGTRAGDMLCDTPNTFSYFFVDSTTVTGQATCVNPQGGSGSVRSTTSAGHIGATAISATTGGAAGQTLSAGGNYQDSAFVFHSSVSGVTTALVSLNVVIAGTLEVGGPFGGAGIDFSIAINGQDVGHVRSSLDSSSSSCTSSFAGGVGCAGGEFSAASLTGMTVPVPLDTPVSVEMRMEVSAGSAATGSSASAIFGNSLDFPVGVPLFNLPVGVTVNAPDSFIFDNLFSPPAAVPEPSAAWLLLAGCAALAWRRAAARALS